jgi:hypothetical protein
VISMEDHVVTIEEEAASYPRSGHEVKHPDTLNQLTRKGPVRSQPGDDLELATSMKKAPHRLTLPHEVNQIEFFHLTRTRPPNGSVLSGTRHLA